MTESHSDVADDYAVIKIKAFACSGLGLSDRDILNSEKISDIFVLGNLGRIICFRIVTELLYILLLGFLGLLYRV